MEQATAPHAKDGNKDKFNDFASSLKNFKGVAELLRNEYGTGKVKEIDRICDWLLSNPKLVKKLAKDISEGNVDIDWTRPSYLAKEYLEISGGSYQNGNLFALGVWLAQRYLCDNFGIKDPKYPKIRQPDKNTKVFLSYNMDEHRIMLIPYVIDSGPPAEAFLKGFGAGLHELGHGLRQTRDKEKYRLSEFAVALIMRELSPPIEQWEGSKVNDTFGKMSVDPLNVKALEGQGFYQDDDSSRLRGRYVAHYIMPWVEGWQDRTGKKLDVFDFKHTPAEREEAEASIKKINDRIGPYLTGAGISISLGDAFYIYRELKWKHDKDDGFVAEHFCKTEGITDPELVKKMREVFLELATEDKPIDFQEFVDKFNAALTKVFGEPKRHDYPPRYGHMPAKENVFFKA